MGYLSLPAQDTLMMCVEEVEIAEYATPQKPLLSMRGEEPLDEELDP